jgi:hypothetical protein
VFYVSATDGSDTNAGTDSNPFKTLARAQDAVRKVSGGGAQVLVQPGVYYEEMLFTPADSGTEADPVVWSAVDPTKPTVVSGGVPVRGGCLPPLSTSLAPAKACSNS